MPAIRLTGFPYFSGRLVPILVGRIVSIHICGINVFLFSGGVSPGRGGAGFARLTRLVYVG